MNHLFLNARQGVQAGQALASLRPEPFEGLPEFLGHPVRTLREVNVKPDPVAALIVSEVRRMLLRRRAEPALAKPRLSEAALSRANKLSLVVALRDRFTSRTAPRL